MLVLSKISTAPQLEEAVRWRHFFLERDAKRANFSFAIEMQCMFRNIFLLLDAQVYYLSGIASVKDHMQQSQNYKSSTQFVFSRNIITPNIQALQTSPPLQYVQKSSTQPFLARISSSGGDLLASYQGYLLLT